MLRYFRFFLFSWLYNLRQVFAFENEIGQRCGLICDLISNKIDSTQVDHLRFAKNSLKFHRSTSFKWTSLKFMSIILVFSCRRPVIISYFWRYLYVGTYLILILEIFKNMSRCLWYRFLFIEEVPYLVLWLKNAVKLWKSFSLKFLLKNVDRVYQIAGIKNYRFTILIICITEIVFSFS